MNRKPLPNRRRSENHKVKVRGVSVFVTIGYYDDGKAGEIFIDTAKAGTEMKQLMESTGKLASLCLQLGSDPEAVAQILGDSAPDTVPSVIAGLIVSEYIHPDDRAVS